LLQIRKDGKRSVFGSSNMRYGRPGENRSSSRTRGKGGSPRAVGGAVGWEGSVLIGRDRQSLRRNHLSFRKKGGGAKGGGCFAIGQGGGCHASPTWLVQPPRVLHAKNEGDARARKAEHTAGSRERVIGADHRAERSSICTWAGPIREPEKTGIGEGCREKGYEGGRGVAPHLIRWTRLNARGICVAQPRGAAQQREGVTTKFNHKTFWGRLGTQQKKMGDQIHLKPQREGLRDQFTTRTGWVNQTKGGGGRRWKLWRKKLQHWQTTGLVKR